MTTALPKTDNLPEKRVVFDARFPQLLGSSVIGEFETDGGLELLKFARSYFDVEIMAFVAYLQDFRPGEPVDPQSVAVNEETGCTDTQHDVYTFRILRRMQIHSVHSQFFCIF